jgi:hypothetical protein
MRDRIGRFGAYTLVGSINIYFLPRALGAAVDPNQSSWDLVLLLGGAVASMGAAVAVAMWSLSGD